MRASSVRIQIGELSIDVAGSYTVQLVVTDFNGVSSAPATHTIEAIPVQELYIALSWDKPLSDVDLHVVPTGGAFFTSEDASFCNTDPDWGSDGTATHSGDASDGYGPETVEISDLSETEYYIGVHYFEDDGGSIVTASITIHVDGEPHETIEALMTHNQFWNVGYIRVIDGVGMFVEADDRIERLQREYEAGNAHHRHRKNGNDRRKGSVGLFLHVQEKRA